jgi:phospholipase/carboxylesterase
VAAVGLDLLAYRVRPARAAARGALVLLHGRGVDENDLYPLLDELDPEAGLVGAAPRCPLTLPPGGNHWYIVERVGFPHRETFLESFDLLSQWLEALAQDTGVPWERTVIGGFSQGAVMSYALALAAGRPSPAGLLAMSGFIPTVEGFDLDLARPGFPIAVTHGTLDPIIGVEFGRTARQRLEASGVRPLYRESPIGHGVDPAVLPDLHAWLDATIELAAQTWAS